MNQWLHGHGLTGISGHGILIPRVQISVGKKSTVRSSSANPESLHTFVKFPRAFGLELGLGFSHEGEPGSDAKWFEVDGCMFM
jgi:hypothetical protein